MSTTIITSGENELFNKRLSLFEDGKKCPEDDFEGYTRYVVSPQDVDLFEGLGDEDEIEIAVYDDEDNRLAYRTYMIFFEDDRVRFEMQDSEGGDDEEYAMPSIIVDTQKEYSIPDDEDYEFITVYAQNNVEYHVAIFSSSKIFFDKNLTDFENKVLVEDDPELEGYYKYVITPGDVDFFNGMDEVDRIWIGVYPIEGGYTWLDASEQYKVIFNGDSSFSLLEVLGIRIFYGNLTSGETADGMISFATDKFIRIDIPQSANVTEMNIEVDYGGETRTYSLSDFNSYGSDPEDEEFEGNAYYMDLTDEIKDLIRQHENQTITFNFNYQYKGQTFSSSFKRVLRDDIFYQIVSISDLYNLFDFNIADDVLVNGDDEAVRIFCFDSNWHWASNDWGGGYFKVYLNNTLVKSIDLFNDLVHGGDYLEAPRYVALNLSDLGISQAGIYNIKISHLPEPEIDTYEDDITGEIITRPCYILVDEKELVSKNIAVELESVEKNSTIEVDEIIFNYGETYSSEVTLVGASDIIATVEDYDEANITFKDGVLTVSGLNAGQYALKITTIPDEGYVAVTTYAIITVNKINSSLMVTALNISVGDDVVVYFEMDERVDGEIRLNLSGIIYAVTIVNGKASMNLGSLNVGAYDATAIFEGNENFNPAVNSTSFIVSKILPTIEVNAGEAVEGSDLEIAVIAPADATGSVVVDGRNVLLINGKATITIENVAAGNLAINVVYEGDEKYLGYTTSINVSVAAKRDPNLVVSVEDINVGETAIVYIEINAEATGKVTVNGDEVEVTNGKATVNLTGLTAGNHTIAVAYSGDKYFKADEKNATITVKEAILPVDSSLMVSALDINVGDVAVVIVEMNEAINGEIIINVAGINYTISVVNGKASLNVSYLNAGAYDVTAIFAGNENFNPAVNSTSFIVSKILPTIEVNAGEAVEGSDLEIAVIAPADATGSVVVDGRNVLLINGKATITIENVAAGNLTINVVYEGDEKYLGNTESVNVTVMAKQDSGLKISVDNITVGEAAIVNIEINAEATGKVTVNGDEVEMTNGKATVNITGLTAGNHTIAVAYSGDKYFKADEKTTTITVKEAILPVNPQLTIDPITDVVEGTDVLVVVIANETFTGRVKFFVGESEVAIINMVDGKGNVTVDSDKFSVGVNTVKVTSEASEHFIAGEDTATFTVTLSKTVTKETFNKYFDENGIYVADLDEIIFVGEFTGIPKITITKALNVTGQNAVFTDALFNINSDNVSVKDLTINVALSDYAVTATGSNQVSLINNSINAINGMLVSDCANFTIDSNTIISTAGENINGILIAGTGSGVVTNNRLDLKSTKTAYAINTNPTGPLRISYIGNNIVAESYFAVGIYDDAEIMKDNIISLSGNYAMGIVVLSENAVVQDNQITLNTTNNGSEDIPEPLGVETAGIKVNKTSNITNNTVNSTGKSMSIVGGSSTIQDNTLNGQVSVASNGNTISNNVITSTEDSAIDASSSTGNIISSNEAYSAQCNGDKAIKAGEGNDVKDNFEKVGPALTISIADITEGADAVIVITTNASFTGDVLVQIANSNRTVRVEMGTGSLPVSGLGIGTYNAVATFMATEIFAESVKNTTFTVKAKVATLITATAVTTTYATSKNIVVILKDANGNVLAGKSVSVVLNGVTKTLTTDAKGQVSLATGTKLAPKTYPVTFTFNGDNGYVKSTGSVKVTVKKATPKLTAKKKTFKAKKTKKYTITLKTDKGKALNKVKVTLKVKGKKYTATVKKGKATFKLKKLTKKGKHTATVTFKGNKYYNKVTKKVKITVKK